MDKKHYIFTVVIVSVLFANSAFGQHCYTVKAVAPAYVLLIDSAIHVTRDTTLIICESYILLTKQNGYNFYNKMVSSSQKHVFLKEIYKMALASPPPDTALEKKSILNATEAYKPYAGRPISKVKIKVLKPFGPSVNDTNRPTISYIERVLDPTHISTKDFVVREKLLFEKGETVDPGVMVENARLLTNLPFLQDAAIVVSPSTGDSVEVLVLVKDKFPWLVVPNIFSINNMSLGIRQANIMGLGQSAGFSLTYDTKSTPEFYLSNIGYSISNLYKLIDANLTYEVGNNSQKTRMTLNRQIIPSKVSLGGGLEVSYNQENLITDPTYIDKSLYYFKYMYYEAWASYILPHKKNSGLSDKSKVYFIPGLSLSKKKFIQRPSVTLDTNSQFFNYDYLLGNIVVAKQDYFKTNYLLNFGKTEYIPYGFQASITSGYSWTEFMHKPYIGAGFSISTHIDKMGFIFGTFDVGAHFTSGYEQGAVYLNIVHLTDLIEHNRSKFRIETELQITSSINRFSNDLLYLGQEYGFVGLNSETFYGQQRTFLETTFINYTPFYLFGFRLAIIGFASVGTIGPQHIKIDNKQLLTNIGVGVYIKNDFLAFNSIEIRVAYFPVTPTGINHFGFSFSSSNLLSRINFLNTKPHQVKYK